MAEIEVNGGRVVYEFMGPGDGEVVVPGTQLIEPPWPEDAWERLVDSMIAGSGTMFDLWVKAAAARLDFMNERGSVSLRR